MTVNAADSLKPPSVSSLWF